VTSSDAGRRARLGHDLDWSDLTALRLDGSPRRPHALLAILEQLHLTPGMATSVSVSLHLPEERPAVSGGLGRLAETCTQGFLLVHRHG